MSEERGTRLFPLNSWFLVLDSWLFFLLLPRPSWFLTLDPFLLPLPLPSRLLALGSWFSPLTAHH